MRLAPSLLFCVVLLSESLALAQSDEAKAEAQRRYEEGVTLHTNGREEDAYVRFAQAYTVVQGPPILFNLARTEQLTGRLVEAAGHFRGYLARPPHPLITHEQRTKAQTFLAQINKQIGHLTIDAPTGTIIAIDGATSAAAGAIEVRPGFHTIVGQLGAQSRSLTVSCLAGETVNVRVDFAPAPVPPLPAPITPAANAPQSVEATPAPPPDAHLPTSRARIGVVVATASLGAIAIGLGIGFEVAASSRATTASRLQSGGASSCFGSTSPKCQQLASAGGSETSDHNVAVGMFVGGGILLAASAVSLLVWPSTTGPTARLVPIVSPTTAGLGYACSF